MMSESFSLSSGIWSDALPETFPIFTGMGEIRPCPDCRIAVFTRPAAAASPRTDTAEARSLSLSGERETTISSLPDTIKGKTVYASQQ